MRCAVFQYNSTDENGNTLSVFKDTSTSVEECGKISTTETVLMSGMQFTELNTKASQVATLDSALASVDPVEVATVYGTSFALIVFLGITAYKIKVAKKIVRLI